VLWQRGGGGGLAEVVGLDCAAVNDEAFVQLRADLRPPPSKEALYFVAGDFSRGLAAWPEDRFQGIVSGLAIQYAESYLERAGRWTTEAYDRVLTEAHRILVPGGRFVFSVNVPEPSWGRVALHSILGAFRHRNPLRYWLKAYRVWRYGGWLKREACRGRFLLHDGGGDPRQAPRRRFRRRRAPAQLRRPGVPLPGLEAGARRASRLIVFSSPVYSPRRAQRAQREKRKGSVDTSRERRPKRFSTRAFCLSYIFCLFSALSAVNNLG
jgi:SAM-dependent methyltransferase